MKNKLISRVMAGISIVSIVQLLAVIAVAGLIAYKTPELRRAYYRNDCYTRQEALDKILWKACNRLGREPVSIGTAYVVQYPSANNQPPKLVIMFLPRGSDAGPSSIAIDLNEFGFTGSAICPMHKGKQAMPIIDYWYMFGRWYCLYDGYHN